MKAYDHHHLHRLDRLNGTPLASFPARAAAFVIDFLAAFALFTLFAVYGAKLLYYFGLLVPSADYTFKFNSTNWSSLIFIVLYFGLWTYFGKGQTPGKRLLKIRVLSLAHDHLSLRHSVERAPGYVASALELGFGFLQYFIHPNKQTVQDRIAETIVIKP